MGDFEEMYLPVVLERDEAEKVAEYINAHPFLWADSILDNLAIAVQCGDYKFVCTGYGGGHGNPVVIISPEGMSYNYVKFNSGMDYGVIYPTGDAQLDQMLVDISFNTPIDEPEIAWLIRKFYGIDSGEFEDDYEEKRSQVREYNFALIRDLLPDIKEKKQEFFKTHKYTSVYYDL